MKKFKISRLVDWWLQGGRSGRPEARPIPFEMGTPRAYEPTGSGQASPRTAVVAGLSTIQPTGKCHVRYLEADQLAIIDETDRVILIGTKQEVEDWLDWRENALRPAAAT